MTYWSKDAAVAVSSIGFVTACMKFDSNMKEDFVQLNGIPAMASAVSNHSLHPLVQLHGIKLIRFLCRDYEIALKMVEHNCKDIVKYAMVNFPDKHNATHKEAVNAYSVLVSTR